MGPVRPALIALAGVSLTLALAIPARGATAGAPARMSAASATPCGSAGAPTSTVYLPNITKTLGGPLGWDTPVYVQNAGAIQTAVEATFYRFSDGAPVVCRKTPGLPPGASLLDDPALDTDLQDDTQFSVVLRSFGAPIVATVEQVQGAGASRETMSYAGFTSGATTVYLPNVTRRFYGYDVPFIIQNLGSTTAAVAARFVSFDGSQALTISRVVEPGRSRVIDPDSDDVALGAPGLTDGTQYAVTLTSTQPIGVVANAENRAIGPVAFSHNGLAAGATTLYAPYAVKGPVFSPVVVQNVGTVTADATLTFTPLSGIGAVQSFTLRAIPAKGARAFDPRFSLGTTTPCAIASASCLGAGEYSLKIQSTAPMAAVVMPNSATTAAGYLAATTLEPRALLPVVARSVGGAGGPTTAMLIQSGSATRATLRYYAVSSGALVTTQEIALPASGVKIDPRSVAGLRDDARYAVTIDGNGGTLIAVALEQAFTGGDTTTMYEGFGVASLPATPQPGSIRVTPASGLVVAGATQQFAAVVNDQFGVAMPFAPLTWTASLGSISPAGTFTAGASSAAGAVSVTSGAVTTSVPVTVQVPLRMTVSGFALSRVTTTSLDLYTDATIGVSDVQRLVTQAVDDVAQIEGDYQTVFRRRPVVYVLPTFTAFSQAVQTIGAGTAPPSWSGGQCVCYGDRNWLFVDWQSASRGADVTTLRHELTHAMEHDLTGDAFLPAWLDEGNARAEEFTIEGMQWWAMQQRYRAASMASQGALFSLADLTSSYAWSARPELQATYQYAVASQAALLLRSDVGMSGNLEILRLVGEGVSFDDAYAAVAGRAFSSFSTTFAQRVRSLAPRYPGIATSTDTPDGPGLAFIIYGLPANAPFTLSISGSNGYQLVGAGGRAADAYGVYASYLGSGWPPATYTISASWAGGTVSAAGAKTASIDAWTDTAGEPAGLNSAP